MIHDNVIDFAKKVDELNPMKTKMAPWIIKKWVRLYVSFVTLPMYCSTHLFNEFKKDE